MAYIFGMKHIHSQCKRVENYKGSPTPY